LANPDVLTNWTERILRHGRVEDVTEITSLISLLLVCRVADPAMSDRIRLQQGFWRGQSFFGNNVPFKQSWVTEAMKLCNETLKASSLQFLCQLLTLDRFIALIFCHN
jgi:hypothetical protein